MPPLASSAQAARAILYGHHLERSPCQELRHPGIFLRVLPGPPQHGMRPDHKNAPQIPVALFRDRPKLLFAPS